jgi:hypothetical protein
MQLQTLTILQKTPFTKIGLMLYFKDKLLQVIQALQDQFQLEWFYEITPKAQKLI